MTDSRRYNLLARPPVLKTIVFIALLFNGVFWAVRFPAWHPNDSQQHYMYATHYDGIEPTLGDPGQAMVPQDLKAFADLVDFGPHRTVRRTIDLSASRAEEMDHLRRIADDPAQAGVYIEDNEAEDMRLIGHPDFEEYHPPLYYALLGQVLRVGGEAGLGIRWRVLMGRMFSVVLGLLAAWLAMLLARVFWPEDWVMPVMVGFATGMQILVAFYTSVFNNEVLLYLLLTAFLVLGARAIVDRPGWLVILGMVVVGLLAGATKITAVVLLPMGLVVLMLCRLPKWLRVSAGFALAVCVVVLLMWLLIPWGGGESLQDSYVGTSVEVRSLPHEMFTPGRLWDHVKMLRWYWGLQIGAACWTDAWMPYHLHDVWSALTILSVGMGLVMLRRLDPARRRMMLFLLSAPVWMGLLLYAIDYRFASMIGGRFIVRAQYYIPIAASQMMWMVWGLGGWFKGRDRTVVVGGLAFALVIFNMWALHGVLSPRYYGQTGWWEQCRQIAEIWPILAAGVAMIDLLALVSGLLAAVCLTIAVRASQDNHETVAT